MTKRPRCDGPLSARPCPAGHRGWGGFPWGCPPHRMAYFHFFCVSHCNLRVVTIMQYPALSRLKRPQPSVNMLQWKRRQSKAQHGTPSRTQRAEHMVQILRKFMEQQAGSGKRSTALQPIIYITSILLLGLIGSFQVNAPLWLSVSLFCMLVGSILLFGVAYIYFMLKNPDALRSEKFNITKVAIEHGLIGDDMLGAILSFEEKQSLPLGSDDEGSS